MNKKLIGWLLAIIALAILGFLLYKKDNKVNNDTKQTSNPETIKVSRGLDSIGSQILFDMAKENDFFSKYNLKVEEVTASKSVSNALTANQVDVAVGQVSTPITQYLNNEDVVWFNTYYSFQPDMYLVHKDLKPNDKVKFGVSKIGGSSQISASTILKQMGWSENSIEYVMSGEIAARFSFLENNKINATFMFPGEGLEQAKVKGYSVINAKQLSENTSDPVGIFTTSKNLSEKKDLLVKFDSALKDFIKYMKNNEDETVKFISNKYNLSTDDSKNVYNNILEFNQKAKTNTDVISETTKVIVRISTPQNPTRDLNEFVRPIN